MIIKESPRNQYDTQNDSADRPASNRDPVFNGQRRSANGTGYSITKRDGITLMSGGISARRRQKNKREREAPQSGIQMLLLFCVHCEARAHPMPVTGREQAGGCDLLQTPVRFIASLLAVVSDKLHKKLV
ncbi:hypothetical protein ACSZM5_16900 [Aeromonas hydrophila]